MRHSSKDRPPSEASGKSRPAGTAGGDAGHRQTAKLLHIGRPNWLAKLTIGDAEAAAAAL